jgi:hypothetical protein
MYTVHRVREAGVVVGFFYKKTRGVLLYFKYQNDVVLTGDV